MNFTCKIAKILSALIVFVAFSASAVGAQSAAKGEKLFKRKCKGCHRLTDGVKMGPGLAGVTYRRTDKWILTWVRDPAKVIASGDKVAVALKKKFKKTMRKLKAMQVKENREDILAFLKENDKKYPELKDQAERRQK